ncbi:MAG TPA: lipid-A-disaccharide synthase [Pirellulaceae bacterium]|nr:lipid-A-disaccharide synthase [Pirellulaceae bacterium]HMO92960.1 lipid-A-disaccharide synthase [Pirellulaceae bacterium]HMP68475.1 lipid-A-disaccharide synthase [Pirellulaceae bacterium]
MRIFFSVGEPSGDLHGANLIREFKRQNPSIECVGFGGPKMVQAGLDAHFDLTQYAVMFFWQVLGKLKTFYQLYRTAAKFLNENQVDAVVLIDYPGFNWWIAKAAKRNNIPVFYFGVPQMWAWGGWRIRKLRKRVDHVICKLPFEQKWFSTRNCPAEYVGHPYMDELANRPLDKTFVNDYAAPHSRLLTLLPGSRDQEVYNNLDWMLDAAQTVTQRFDDVQVAIACYNAEQASYVQDRTRKLGLPFDVMSGRTAELIRLADVCLACSGSVSLELMYHRKPSVIIYRISTLQYLLKTIFLKVPYITLVNLIWMQDLDRKWSEMPAGASSELPFPEFVRVGSPVSEISLHLRRLLSRPAVYQQAVERIDKVATMVEQKGATVRAANTILTALARRSSSQINATYGIDNDLISERRAA